MNDTIEAEQGQVDTTEETVVEQNNDDEPDESPALSMSM